MSAREREVTAADKPAGKRFLTARQVAERYQMTVGWVYNDPYLQHIALRFGKYLRFRESDLEGFERSRSSRRGFDLVIRRTLHEADLKKAAAERPKFRLLMDIRDKDEGDD